MQRVALQPQSSHVDQLQHSLTKKSHLYDFAASCGTCVQRVVGVPDPEDDCLVVWSLIKNGEAPKQIIPGGEYFSLKKIEPEPYASIPESARP